jgi:glycosyltransferase involved in cell wall biosynthesis
VIIPAWRAASTIGAAVQSVLAQTVAVHEVLVIDDGSPDDIAGALRGYPSHVRVIRQENGGASAARNRGLDEARGDWIAFLDADDAWLPERLEQQFRLMDQHPEARFVTGKYVLRNVSGKDRIAGPPVRLCGRLLRLTGAQAFGFSAACWTGTVLVHREAVAAHRFRTDLRTAEDREFWLRIVLEVPALSVATPLAVHQVRPGSLSTSDIDDDCRNMLTVVAMYEHEIGAEAARHWRAAVHRRAASVHLAERRWRQARSAAWVRLRMEPGVLEAWWVLLRTLVPIAVR